MVCQGFEGCLKISSPFRGNLVGKSQIQKNFSLDSKSRWKPLYRLPFVILTKLQRSPAAGPPASDMDQGEDPHATVRAQECVAVFETGVQPHKVRSRRPERAGARPMMQPLRGCSYRMRAGARIRYCDSQKKPLRRRRAQDFVSFLVFLFDFIHF